MNVDWINSASQKELERFRSVCHQLLSCTYLVRTVIVNGARVSNPDYHFLSAHFEEVQEYLSLLGWDLRKDDLNGFFYISSADEANRRQLNKKETAILLTVRLLYEENLEHLGIEQDAICTVRDVLEKAVTDYAILPAKPNMDDLRKIFAVMENHSLIQRIEGRYSQTDCKFAILPTILSAVSAEKMAALVAALRKEEKDEEADEDPAD